MKRLLLPLLLGLFGLGGGAGAGYVLRPPPAETTGEDPACVPAGGADHDLAGPSGGEEAEPTSDFVKLNNQFVVPVVEEGEVAALVILSLTLEVTLGESERVYTIEPKLRDSFLQVLFDHANADGFAGAFTASNNMDILRRALIEAARAALGDVVRDVLIVDIVRQDG